MPHPPRHIQSSGSSASAASEGLGTWSWTQLLAQLVEHAHDLSGSATTLPPARQLRQPNAFQQSALFGIWAQLQQQRN